MTKKLKENVSSISNFSNIDNRELGAVAGGFSPIFNVAGDDKVNLYIQPDISFSGAFGGSWGASVDNNPLSLTLSSPLATGTASLNSVSIGVNIRF